MKYIGTYSNDADIATKAKVDAKQDKVLVDGILKGDGQGAISAAETQEVELVELTKADVGLGNVDNTSDANKPISTATQTALNGKQDAITGGASTITSNNLTANRALVSDASGKVAVSEVTSTELGYLDGVTSNIQTQLNGKLSAAPVTSVNSKTGAVVLSASDVGAQPAITANGFLKGDGSGSITADKPLFVVNFSGSGNTLTSDKTVKQIYDAYSAGYSVIGYQDLMVLQLITCNNTANTYYIGFGTVDVGQSVITRTLNERIIWADDAPEGNTAFMATDFVTVPPTRTINNKPLSANITLNAADVNAVGLSGSEIIGGNKTFYNTTTFIEQPEFFGGMHISGSTSYNENSTVDFTEATVTGLSGLLPTVTASDNGKFLRVVNGAWAAATVENANGVSF